MSELPDGWSVDENVYDSTAGDDVRNFPEYIDEQQKWRSRCIRSFPNDRTMDRDNGSGENDIDGSSDSSFDSARAERDAHYPDAGYNLVEINMMRPPGEALTTLRHSLTLSAISMPAATEFEDYVVYDQAGRAYDHSDLTDADDTAGVDATEVDDLIEAVQTDTGKAQRLALRDLARLAGDDPGPCLSAIPALTTLVRESPPGVQAEALTILAAIADEYPQQVTPAAADVLPVLTADSYSDVLADAISIVAAIADADSEAVVDAVPKLAALLQEDPPAEATAITALKRIASTHPDAVLPITPQLHTYIEAGSENHRIGAIAVLGMLSKEYPHVAEETTPAAIQLLDADSYKLRANAAGLLADLAEEYPDEVRPAVPRVIELLDDDDEKARYNATSILARVAKAYPEAVEAGIEPLIEALDEEFPWARSNGCWALGYLQAEQALERLEVLEQNDPNKEVRSAAAFAISEIEDP